MSPSGHLAVGAAGSATIYVISNNTLLATGFFFGSWLITDLDHIIYYWMKNNFKKPFNMKGMMNSHNERTKTYLEAKLLPLHVLPMHSIEFFLIIFSLFLYTKSFLLLGVFIGGILHKIIDDIGVIWEVGPSFQRSCHSILEYFIRKLFFNIK